MTPEQLTMMEDELHVILPSAYKQVLSAFPWPEFAASTELSLWDDAALNVERTLEYREGYGGAPPWPSDYIHIGDDDDACPYALHCSDGTIVKTDHGDLTARPLARFVSVELFVRELRETLNNEAVMIRWDTCKEDFRCDGSLRDIYISPATLSDWRALYPHLRGYPEVEYLVDGTVEPPPDSVDQVFAVRPSGSPVLRFNVGRACVAFHFFSDEEIECDFYPNDITSQVDLDALLAFVRQLGDVTRKRVIITPENVRECPFITYDPESREFEHHDIAA